MCAVTTDYSSVENSNTTINNSIADLSINEGLNTQLPWKEAPIDLVNAIPQLTRSFQTYYQVTEYITSIIHGIFPKSIWGSKYNKKVFNSKVDKFIKLKRFETFHSSFILRDFVINDINWLYKDSNRKSNLPPQDLQLRKYVFHKLLLWIFDRCIIPLLRNNFYCTDTQPHKYRVFYYRWSVWHKVERISMMKLKDSIFEELSMDKLKEIFENRKMGCAYLRLMPKSDGVRPILNMKKRDCIPKFNLKRSNGSTTTTTTTTSTTSVNNLLRNSFSVLRYEKTNNEIRQKLLMEKNPDCWNLEETYAFFVASGMDINDANVIKNELKIDGGTIFGENFEENNEVIQSIVEHLVNPDKLFSIIQDVYNALSGEHSGYYFADVSVLGTNKVHTKLYDYKQRLSKKFKHIPKLYFVKTDIKSCYDSILPGKMLEIVSSLFKSDEYYVQNYKEYRLEKNRVEQYQRSDVKVSSEYPQFYKQALILAERLSRCVLSEMVSFTRKESRDEILKKIQDHIRSNVIVTEYRGRPKYLIQTKGIPQGSIMSGHLCTLYYSCMEFEHLNRFIQSSDDTDESVFIRFVDDTLYITTNLDKAKDFVLSMHEGFPDYGFVVNSDKTVTNFKMDIESINLKPCKKEVFDGIEKEYMSWCGWMIDTGTLDIMSDFERYKGKRISDSMTISNYTSNQGKLLSSKILTYCLQKYHPLLFNTNLNSDQTVCQNVFNSICFATIKYVAHCKKLFDVSKNVKFHINLLNTIIKYHYSLIRRQENKNSGIFACTLSFDQIRRIGYHAIKHVIHRKQSLFKPLIPFLQYTTTILYPINGVIPWSINIKWIDGILY
eukprot:TRINITY_DN2861_c0_g1_i1.p1 TRINITY_DN2861_c0_g1~~TRINITY_DN2861_c0_g1_i1.p1  ORF type:complete len:926 (-),score=132.29 TRINITY_DN2861_c0_g1_i1:1383-3878(-)